MNYPLAIIAQRSQITVRKQYDYHRVPCDSPSLDDMRRTVDSVG